MSSEDPIREGLRIAARHYPMLLDKDDDSFFREVEREIVEQWGDDVVERMADESSPEPIAALLRRAAFAVQSRRVSRALDPVLSESDIAMLKGIGIA